MRLNALQPDHTAVSLLSGTGTRPPRPDAGMDFASILGIENRVLNGNEASAEDARSAAEAFVAKAFIEPMLALAREANDQPPPFGPGQGEKQFGALIDAQRALDLVRSASWPIVERLTSDMTRGEAGSHLDASV